MMLSHQQMGHDAARAVGEHDATMDNFVISQDWGRSTRFQRYERFQCTKNGLFKVLIQVEFIL
jgi:hypothetical protein